MATETGGLTIGGWEIAEDVSEWIEILAIAVIAIAVLIAFAAGLRALRSSGLDGATETVKQHIGRGLLLSLDLLIAADVIRTVTLEPTLENVGALGLLVVVRTFLTWSLVVELEHRLPWRSTGKEPSPSTPAGRGA